MNTTVPVFEFRPLPSDLWNAPKERYGKILRYADGAWIPDDGEYDLAFIGHERNPSNGNTFPVCFYVSPHGRENIVCSWVTDTYWRNEPKHPDGNAWHHVLREGTTDWGGYTDNYNHPNKIASDSGMDKTCSMYGCANGRCVEFKVDSPHIALGLLRYRDTKQIYSYPPNMSCTYCGAIPPLPREYYLTRCTHPEEHIADDGGETFCQLCGHIISSLGDEE